MAVKKSVPVAEAKVESKAEAPVAQVTKKGKAVGATAKFLSGEAAAPAPTAEAAQAQVQETKAATQKTKTKGKKLDTTDFIILTANAIINLPADKLIARIHTLIESAGENDFELGIALSSCQQHGYWDGQGYDNFRAYVEGVFGLAYRKAMYFIEISDALIDSGVPWEAVKSVGWTKLKEIAKLLTPENVEDWVAKASELTTNQLIEHIKAQKSAAAGGTAAAGSVKANATTGAEAITTKTFKLHKDQKEVVDMALAKAMEESGTEVEAVALTHACTTYLEAGTGKAKGAVKVAKAQTIEEMIEAMKGTDLKATLHTIMAKVGYEEVLEVFEEVFPDINLEVTD